MWGVGNPTQGSIERTPYIWLQHRPTGNTPRVFREGEDERPSRENTQGTTQLVRRILTWTMVKMDYQYGNLCKNLTGLRYTKQEPYQEELNSAEDLLYLLKPLRSTWMRSMVNKTKKAQLQGIQQTAGKKGLQWPPGRGTHVKIWIRSWKELRNFHLCQQLCMR